MIELVIFLNSFTLEFEIARADYAKNPSPRKNVWLICKKCANPVIVTSEVTVTGTESPHEPNVFLLLLHKRQEHKHVLLNNLEFICPKVNRPILDARLTIKVHLTGFEEVLTVVTGGGSG